MSTLILYLVLELHVFLHRSRDAKLFIDTTTKTVKYRSKTVASSKWELLHFSEDCKSTLCRMSCISKLNLSLAIIQCYPFKKGRALHFVNCGLYTRLHGLGPTERVGYKTMYVHLPESAGLVHEEYVRPDKEHGFGGEGKIYGRYYEERAERNEEVFDEFLVKLRSIMGQDKVVMCKSSDDATLNGADIRTKQ
jgi:hypothetical protein